MAVVRSRVANGQPEVTLTCHHASTVLPQVGMIGCAGAVRDRRFRRRRRARQAVQRDNARRLPWRRLAGERADPGWPHRQLRRRACDVADMADRRRGSCRNPRCGRPQARRWHRGFGLGWRNPPQSNHRPRLATPRCRRARPTHRRRLPGRGQPDPCGSQRIRARRHLGPSRLDRTGRHGLHGDGGRCGQGRPARPGLGPEPRDGAGRGDRSRCLSASHRCTADGSERALRGAFHRGPRARRTEL